MINEPTPKPWYESKLVWAGVIVFLTAILQWTTNATLTWLDLVQALLGAAITVIRIFFTDIPVRLIR